MKIYWKIVQISMSVICLSQAVYAEPVNQMAAVVNDSVITHQELLAQINTQKAHLQQRQIPLPAENALKEQVLRHMIDTEIQLQLAKSNNIEISFDDVSKAIITIAKNNKISIAELKQSILNSGDTWKNYRASIKKEMLLSTLQRKSIGQVIVSDEQVNDYLKAYNQKGDYKYHVKDLLLPLTEEPSSTELVLVQKQATDILHRLEKGLPFEKGTVELSSGKVQLTVSDLGIRSLSSLPHMFSDKIITMKKGAVVGPIRAANGLHIIKLLDIKGGAPAQMITVSHVKHILLKPTAETPSLVQKKKLEALLVKINHGDSFEALAKQFSDDLGSAKVGGDLGWVHQGETVPEFEQSFTQLKPGSVSAPVKSAFGWHLIKLIGHKQIDNTKNNQKQQVKQALYQQKFNEALENWLQHVRASAYIQTFI